MAGKCHDLDLTTLLWTTEWLLLPLQDGLCKRLSFLWFFCAGSSVVCTTLKFNYHQSFATRYLIFWTKTKLNSKSAFKVDLKTMTEQANAKTPVNQSELAYFLIYFIISHQDKLNRAMNLIKLKTLSARKISDFFQRLLKRETFLQNMQNN